MAGNDKFAELRKRLLFVLGAMIIFRIGTFIPVPGIDPTVLSSLFDQQKGSILGVFNMFSGGALGRMSLFALGIMPYISASIIMQLLAVTVPSLEQLKKEGEPGRKKIAMYTRYFTLVLATFQSIGISTALQSQSMGGQALVMNPGFSFIFTAAVTLVTGTMFLMWLGEQVTERGIGNGISIIIVTGIVAGLPSAIGGTLELVRTGEMHTLAILVLAVLVFSVIAFIVFIERGQRRITVNYAKKQQGRRMYQAQSSHLPLKLNMAGVIPPIFASSIILFPATMASWTGQTEGMEWMADIAAKISPGQPIYIFLFAIAIIFFCFFYTALQFNARDTADNLKKGGAFVPGIRPGEQTAKYIDKVLTRLTFVGALYITSVCLLPEFLILYWNVPFYFGGTSLLIIVVVMMDFMAQIQSHLMSHQYDGIMQKANLSGMKR
jgi:preprotein translocase subunit SecY